jgi:hypothetical protein
MLDIICTCNDVEELILQNEMVTNSKLNYTFNFLTNNEDEELIKNIKSNINNIIFRLPVNLGKHLGAFSLASASKVLCNNPYVLHYHADMVFEDINLIKGMLEDFIKSGKKIAGIPRQWVFDNEGNFIDNKSIPFRSEFFFMERGLYENVFNMERYWIYERQCLKNKHTSLDFEPIIYASLELSGIDFNKDIYYLEDVKQMKELLGDEIVYYNHTFPKTKIYRKQ